MERSTCATEVMPDFFKHFWVRRMALDRRNYTQLVETTARARAQGGRREIVGASSRTSRTRASRTARWSWRPSRGHRKLGTADIDARLEELLVDGMLYSFQEQTGDDGDVMLERVRNRRERAWRTRAKPYLPQICGTIKWRLNNKIRGGAAAGADLIARVAAS